MPRGAKHFAPPENSLVKENSRGISAAVADWVASCYCTTRVTPVLWLTVPLAAVTVTAYVPAAVFMTLWVLLIEDSLLQPVSIADAISIRHNRPASCIVPRRFRMLREKSGSIRHKAIGARRPYRSVPSRDLFRDAVTVCCVAILRVTVVGAEPTAKLAGLKVQLAYAGRLLQLMVTVPV